MRCSAYEESQEGCEVSVRFCPFLGVDPRRARSARSRARQRLGDQDRRLVTSCRAVLDPVPS